jgi:hypothetical protein
MKSKNPEKEIRSLEEIVAKRPYMSEETKGGGYLSVSTTNAEAKTISAVPD